MPGSYESVKEAVLERVRPTQAERDRLESVVEDLLQRTREAIETQGVTADVTHVGSTARDTWISGELDIDIFVRFPPEISRDELRRVGLAIGHAVLPDGQEEYAEHPYVTGSLDGFDVDLVPCYAVESATEIATSVDRTPFHNEYVRERLTDDHVDDVRVFKQFLMAVGAYGSDLQTRGFSGYLTEVLVLEFDSARRLFEAASEWQPPVELDPEGHGERTFDDPLVVIDPTDPTRNVAAVVAAENVARLQHHSRVLLDEPTVDRFFPRAPEPMTREAVETEIDRRGTQPVAVVFETPDLVPDQLYPQLRKSLNGIEAALDRQGFDMLRSTLFATDRTVLLFELEVAERPAIERHLGPPVSAEGHADRFLSAYEEADVYGPFIEGDRYIVERDRGVTTATEYLESQAIFETRLGPAIEATLEAGYEVVVGRDVVALTDEFGVDLARYFDPRP